MPAVLIWPLIAGGVGAVGGFLLGSRTKNLAVMMAGGAVIMYLIKRG